MNIFKRQLCFRLFDGEGADGAGATDGGDVSGISAEARAFAKSIGLSEYAEESKKQEPQIEYGKADEGDSTKGQVGTDQGAKGKTDDSLPTGDEGAENPEAEFKELISKGGRFSEIYGKMVQAAVQTRFKNYEDIQAELDSTHDALGILYERYGLEIGDTEGLRDAIEGDDLLIADAADEEGLSLEKYREQMALRAEAAKGRSLQEEIRKEAERREVYNGWVNEAEELKSAFPNFDLNAELSNDVFIESLNRIGNVKDAFLVTHMDEILSGAIKTSEKEATDKVVASIKSRQARPSENGAATGPAVERKTDPSKLTNEDMDKIFEGVSRGKTYSF